MHQLRNKNKFLKKEKRSTKTAIHTILLKASLEELTENHSTRFTHIHPFYVNIHFQDFLFFFFQNHIKIIIGIKGGPHIYL